MIEVYSKVLSLFVTFILDKVLFVVIDYHIKRWLDLCAIEFSRLRGNQTVIRLWEDIALGTRRVCHRL